jgi:hypothetical protein
MKEVPTLIHGGKYSFSLLNDFGYRALGSVQLIFLFPRALRFIAGDCGVGISCEKPPA